MALAGENKTESPYACAARELIALGYHAIPIIPAFAAHPGAGKAPGEHRKGEWYGARDWQRYRDRAPTEFEREVWTRNYPDANIGIVCGSRIDDAHVLIAVDIDTKDFDEFTLLKSQLPASPMAKKGAKGLTLFYRAPADAAITSRNYDKPTGLTDHKTGKPKLSRIADLLTGADTRQTVAPPSVHPDGPIYHWVAGPVAAVELPVFDADALEKFEEACWSIGCIDKRKVTRERPANTAPADSDDYWSETKAAAMARFGDWVPLLGLHKLQQSGRGYKAVAPWRSSGSGKTLDQRTANLSIQPQGIKDFGSQDTFSPIDLVMHARSCDVDQATAWLRDQLGLDGPRIELAEAEPVRVAVNEIGDTWDAETGEVLTEGVQIAPEPALPAIIDADDGELPKILTEPTGLLGALTDWITNTARRPQRGFALGAALTILGTLAGRVYGGPTRSGTHLYVLGVGPTSCGKDHPHAMITEILLEADLEKYLGPSIIKSDSALVAAIRTKPASVIPADEFGGVLGRIVNSKSEHVRGILDPLRENWGKSFKTMGEVVYADRTLPRVHSPAMSLFGVTTADEFYGALGSAALSNGLLNRFLLIETKRKPRDREEDDVSIALPLHIITDLRALANAGNSLVSATSNHSKAQGPQNVVGWASDDAKAAWKQFKKDIEKREEVSSLYGRTVEIALRMATICAIGNDYERQFSAPRITLRDFEWASKLALWSADRMTQSGKDYIANNPHQQQAKLVMRAIKAAGSITKERLRVVLDGEVPARNLKDILEDLDEAGRIETVKGGGVSTGGRRPDLFTWRG